MAAQTVSLEASLRILAWTIGTSFVIALLAVGQNIFAPLVVAVFLWLVMNALVDVLGKTPGIAALPAWTHFGIAQVATLAAVVLAIVVVGDAIAGMAKDAPDLQKRLIAAIVQIEEATGVEIAPAVKSLREQIDAGNVVSSVVSAVAAIAGMSGLVLVYTLFMFLEQRVFARKIAALFPDRESAKSVSGMLTRVTEVVSRYIATKFAVATITGGTSFVILAVAGVPNPVFWAFLIFLLDFIPTIGSLAAVFFATLAALAHFGAVGPTLGVGAALAAVQMTMGNLVEPRWMGTTLNLSPLAVILSLAVWGTIWGTIGLFLAVPLTAAAAIVLAEFAATRPLAIALSLKGGLQRSGTDEKGTP